MSEQLKFLSESKIFQLERNIEQNLTVYADTAETFKDSVTDDDVKLAKDAKFDPDLVTKIRIPSEDEKSTSDAYNSVLVYESIPISPMHACDARIWVYFAHFVLKDYVAKRWDLPSDATKHVSHIRSHYFVKGNRGLTRNNAISRLWWMGFIASRCTKLGSPREALEILCLQSDVRAQLLERNLSMNPDIFDAVVSILKPDYETAKNKIGNTLFNRDRFRDVMKSLNRVGGYRMLDAFGFDNLYDELKEIAETAQA